MLDNYEIDLTRKYDKSSTLSHCLITIAGHIKRQIRANRDWTNFNLYKNKKVFGCPIQFEDFCEVLANLNLYIDEYTRLRKIEKQLRIDFEQWSTGYKIPSLIDFCQAIKHNDNPYQNFYDRLQLYYFFYYIDYTTSDLRGFDSYCDFEIVPIQEEDKHFYFKTTWKLLEIMFNPILSSDEKQSILNKQYTSCDKIRNSTKATKMILRKENVLTETIPKSSQRILLEEFRKRCHARSAPRQLKRLYEIK